MKLRLHSDMRVLILPCIFFALSIGVTFSSQALLARVLTPAEFGEFMAKYALLAILASILTLGFDIAALKFSSRYFAIQDQKLFGEFFRFAVLLISLTCAGFTLFLVVSNYLFSKLIFDFSSVFILSAISWAACKFFTAVLRAMQFNNLSIWIDRILRDCVLLVSTLVLMMQLPGREIFGFLELLLFFGITSGAVVAFFKIMLSFELFNTTKSGSFSDRKKWLLTSLIVWAINIAELTVSRMEILVLSSNGRNVDAGLVAIVITISSLVLIPLLGLNLVFQPILGAIDGQKNPMELKKVVQRFSWLNVPLTLLAAAPVFFYPSYFVSMFGAEMKNPDLVYAIQILVGSRLATCVIGPTPTVLLMNGGQFKFLIVYLLIAMVKFMAIYLYVDQLTFLEVVYISTFFNVLLQVLALVIVKAEFKFIVGMK